MVSFLCVSDVETVDTSNAMAAMLSALVPSELLVIWFQSFGVDYGQQYLGGNPIC
jgi:hypothetical protein